MTARTLPTSEEKIVSSPEEDKGNWSTSGLTSNTQAIKEEPTKQ